jgi:hypothetical protein
VADDDDNQDGPSKPGYWRNVANDVWRTKAAEHRARGEDDLAASATRSASIAALIADRRSVDAGEPLPEAWKAALDADRSAEDWERRGDAANAEYHRNVSLYYALIGLDESPAR